MTTERALATRQPHSLTTLQPQPVDTLGDYGIPDEELRPPRLRFDGKLGRFTNTITGEVLDRVRVVVLRRLTPTRVMWNPDTSDEDHKILCASRDAVTADDSQQAAAIGAGPECTGCRFAQFGEDKNGNPTKQPCSQYLNSAVVLSDDEMPIPFVFGAKSTGIKPMRSALQQLTWLAKGARARGIPSYALQLELAPGPLTGKAPNQYFPLTVKVLADRLDEERWPELYALYQAITNATVEIMPDVDEDAIDSEVRSATDDGPRFMDGAELTRQMDARDAEAAAGQTEGDSTPTTPQPAMFDTSAARTDPADVRPRGKA